MDKNALVSSSALVSGILLYKISPEVCCKLSSLFCLLGLTTVFFVRCFVPEEWQLHGILLCNSKSAQEYMCGRVCLSKTVIQALGFVPL